MVPVRYSACVQRIAIISRFQTQDKTSSNTRISEVVLRRHWGEWWVEVVVKPSPESPLPPLKAPKWNQSTGEPSFKTSLSGLPSSQMASSPNYRAFLELTLLSFIWVLPASSKYCIYIKFYSETLRIYISGAWVHCPFQGQKHWAYCMFITLPPLEVSSLEVRNSNFCSRHNTHFHFMPALCILWLVRCFFA